MEMHGTHIPSCKRLASKKEIDALEHELKGPVSSSEVESVKEESELTRSLVHSVNLSHS